ncbi:MAG: hypothetical protein IGS38_19385 [Synechococcales cyanobacterium M58_A2018_015]|nr:hypothetical protein [Synechococcales cyanobacterium M58_A2018_015]
MSWFKQTNRLKRAELGSGSLSKQATTQQTEHLKTIGASLKCAIQEALQRQSLLQHQYGVMVTQAQALIQRASYQQHQGDVGTARSLLIQKNKLLVQATRLKTRIESCDAEIQSLRQNLAHIEDQLDASQQWLEAP